MGQPLAALDRRDQPLFRKKAHSEHPWLRGMICSSRLFQGACLTAAATTRLFHDGRTPGTYSGKSTTRYGVYRLHSTEWASVLCTLYELKNKGMYLPALTRTAPFRIDSGRNTREKLMDDLTVRGIIIGTILTSTNHGIVTDKASNVPKYLVYLKRVPMVS